MEKKKSRSGVPLRFPSHKHYRCYTGKSTKYLNKKEAITATQNDNDIINKNDEGDGDDENGDNVNNINKQ